MRDANERWYLVENDVGMFFDFVMSKNMELSRYQTVLVSW